MSFVRKSGCRFAVSLCLGSLALSGCATLPSSGPTRSEIIESAQEPDPSASPIQVVPVIAIEDVPTDPSPSPTIGALQSTGIGASDIVGPADVLDISIYEAGVTLFQGSASGAPGEVAAEPGVKVERLPPSRVDDDGFISIPYAGRLRVAGLTVGQIQVLIRRSLLRLSQNPQVLVGLREVISNSIIVSGEVARPGRLVLQTNRETLSDVIALAGGYRGDVKDLALRVGRGDQVFNVRLGELVENAALDVRLQPGDRVTVISNPRTFSVLGASGRVDQITFNKSAVSLVEAVSIVGGVNPNLGDPAAIFVFRYVVDAEGERVPVVYHVDMTQTRSFFLAQRFAMVDRDVLYFGNAASNEPTKLIQLISQLFSPIVAITSAAQQLNQ